MEKSDDYPAEARIFIDLKKGSIDIEHISEKRGRFWLVQNMIAPTISQFFSIICMVFYPIFLLIGYLLLFSFSFGEISARVFFLVTSLIVFLSILLIYGGILISYPLTFIPGFNSKIFPKIGYILAKMTSLSTKITVTEIEKKQFIIPMFQNVYMGYKLYGDYKNTLSKIQILEHPFHYMQKEKDKFVSCHHWYAEFIFDKKPKNGMMEIEYI